MQQIAGNGVGFLKIVFGVVPQTPPVGGGYPNLLFLNLENDLRMP